MVSSIDVVDNGGKHGKQTRQFLSRGFYGNKEERKIVMLIGDDAILSLPRFNLFVNLTNLVYS